MAKIQLLLLDEDHLYAERLAAFINSSEYADRMQPKLFTKTEYVDKLLEANSDSCILLASESFLPECVKYKELLCMLSISNVGLTDDFSDPDLPSLYRFQPLQQLLSRILDFYQGKHTIHSTLSKKTTQVVSFYSAIGNCGKTLSAVHLARELAFRGKKVLYLNLEAPSFAFHLLQGADPQHFSQILYFVKSMPEQLKSKLGLFIKQDFRLGIDYLSPCHHLREAQEMSADETRLLIESLVEMNSYDFIILDLEASLHERISQALKLSDFTLWLVLDELNCLHKTKSVRKLLGALSSGIHYVLNKYTGTISNDFGSADIVFSGYLPYMPEWKTINSLEPFFTGGIFPDQVMQAFEANHRKGALV
jgi:cellulose biosynthesis protein BcsQ